ncbi:60S ribosomal subunit assembly/export protein [Xylographa opegraphella]|nr:60S ribosomal subunit assembly/export protein [Xylographa opegraphella]
MAPTRGASKPARGGGNKTTKTSTRKPVTSASKSRVTKKVNLPPPKQQKTKSASSVVKNGAGKRKRKVYTDKELGLPTLNMITPVGVEAPKGKKRGKVFVDDAESMMTILAMVNADKEGQIESKMMKSRQMEEIREARKAEAEKREQMRKGKLEEKKDSMKKKRTRKSGEEDGEMIKSDRSREVKPFKARKRVSFG